MNKLTREILDQLKGVRQSGRGYMARCPAHNDKNPSLSVTQAEDGRILLHCFAGCRVEEVCNALGVGMGHLFPDSGQLPGPGKKQRNTDRDFEELRRRAFIAMCEFRDLTLLLLDVYDLDDMPDEVVKAAQMLPQLEYYIEILCTKTNDDQLQLLREGVLTKWAKLYNSTN